MLVRRKELEGHRVRILLETNNFPYLIVMEIIEIIELIIEMGPHHLSGKVYLLYKPTGSLSQKWHKEYYFGNSYLQESSIVLGVQELS